MFVSRFSDETWAGFVEARRPTQMVYNLHEAPPGVQVVEVDVKLAGSAP